MKKYLIVIASLLVLTACSNTTASDVKTNSLSYTADITSGSNPIMLNTGLPVKKLVISSANGTHEFQVEIASNDAQRKVGLMNRTSLDDDKGMLFIFNTSGIVNFWMKNTLIPLDMVYMDSNGYIQHISKDAQPCTSADDRECALYNSEKSVQYVLELKGGITDKLGVKDGDRATWL